MKDTFRKHNISIVLAALLFVGIFLLNGCVDYSSENQHSTTMEQDIVTTERMIKQESGSDLLGEEKQQVLSLDSVPAYHSSSYVIVHNNQPFFTEEDICTEPFENYSALDSLGRCGVAYANICKEIMPTDKRGEIGSVRPSGWKTVKYNGYVDGNYLYNRCHLIGYQLAGENANECNLITGTRYLNVEGMLPFENEVANYVQRTENHVLYRVTPIFEGENLVASGVLMEAQSVEDEGKGVCFCVYTYNVQPGISIDYATGDSQLLEGWLVEERNQNQEISKNEQTKQQEKKEQAHKTAQNEGSFVNPSAANHYVINTNTGKFHRSNCKSISQMKEKNKMEFDGTRDEVIAKGYEPCKNCQP